MTIQLASERRRAREAAKPRPVSIKTQVEGSGTAPTAVVRAEKPKYIESHLRSPEVFAI